MNIFGQYRAPCADLRCPAHLTGSAADCECGGWVKFVQRHFDDRGEWTADQESFDEHYADEIEGES